MACGKETSRAIKVSSFRQSRGLTVRAAQSGLSGVASAAPIGAGHRSGDCSLPEAQMVQPFVLCFLVTDVLADRRFTRPF
jgi:hypothetical protein